MKSLTPILSLVLAILLLTHCGTDNPTSPGTDSNIVSREIGPDGGTVTSSDGRLTLEIPKGALSGMETITIEVLDTTDLSAKFDDADAVYDLGPDGLTFDESIIVSYEKKFEEAPDTTDLFVPIGIIVSLEDDSDSPNILENIVINAETQSNSFSVNGELNHFSRVFVRFDQLSGGITLNIEKEEIEVGEKNKVGIKAYIKEVGPESPIAFLFDTPYKLFGVLFTDKTFENGIRLQPTDPDPPIIDYPLETSRNDFNTFIKEEFIYTCIKENSPGDEVLRGTIKFALTHSILENRTLTVPIGNEEDDDKIVVKCKLPDPPTPQDIIQAGVTGPEFFSFIPNPWGELSFNSNNPFLLVVAGANGISVIDPAAEEVVEVFPLPEGVTDPLFGLLPLDPFEDFEGNLTHWILAYGEAGWYLQEILVDGNGNPQQGDIRPLNTGPTEGTTTAAIGTGGLDGTDGGSDSPIITEALNGRIVEDKDRDGSADVSNNVFNNEVLLDVDDGDFPDINSAPIAVYRQSTTERGDLGDIIAVTQGIGSEEPGQLYVAATDITGDAYSPAGLVNTVGFDVRSIECEENPKRNRELNEGEAQILCFTFNFGSNSLSPYKHFADNRGLTVLEEIPVNNGPVTGDSRLVNNGSAVEVLSTGFNDGGIDVTQVDFMGNILNEATGSVPSACVNPGSIRYNPENPDEAFVSCNGSDNIAKIDLDMIR